MNDSLEERNGSVRRRGGQGGAAPGLGGPPLVLVASICVGLLFGGLAIGVALGGVMPLPYGPVAAVQQYVRAQPVAVQVLAVAAFGSSGPLAIYARAAR